MLVQVLLVVGVTLQALPDVAGDGPAMAIEEQRLVKEIVMPLAALGVSVNGQGNVQTTGAAMDLPASSCDVSNYADRVRTGAFTEIWPDGAGQETPVEVQGAIWTAAIQASLDEHGAAYIPARESPYYLDGPLVLRSGHRLLVADSAEIRLKPGTGTCMVRNERMLSGQEGAVGIPAEADHDIWVSGGIWTTLATSASQANGNASARSDADGAIHSHGVFSFNTVRRIRLTNITIRQCKPHGIQMSNCEQFLIEGVRFENHRRDGVHINGPACFGVIREIANAEGIMGDDMIALNGWDWKNTAMTFGPIHHLLVENVKGSSPDGEQASRAEIRLLGGTKRFADGSALDCDIHGCVLRDINGIRTFKMYDQPNLELGRDNDYADPIGSMRNLYFSGIGIGLPLDAALFQVGSNVQDINLRNVALGFDPAAPGHVFTLVQVGPLSMTIQFNPQDPATWVEVFSPDKDCTVRGLRIADVTAAGQGLDPNSLVRVIEQQINENYPNTTPRGGTGKGHLEP